MFAGTSTRVRRIMTAAAAFAVLASLASTYPAGAAAAPTPAAGGGCGSVTIGSSGSADVLKAENCFSNAYATCDDARFSVAFQGADAGVARTFVTMHDDANSKCEVAEIVDHLKGSTVASSDTYLCNDARQSSDGLTFKNCGAEGDVFVPADLTSASAKRLLTIAFAPGLM
jgi:hypothetical protein